MALKLIMEPVFEVDFYPPSYGYRPGRRAQDAIAEIHHFTHKPSTYEWVIEGDIKARALRDPQDADVPPLGRGAHEVSGRIVEVEAVVGQTDLDRGPGRQGSAADAHLDGDVLVAKHVDVLGDRYVDRRTRQRPEVVARIGQHAKQGDPMVGICPASGGEVERRAPAAVPAAVQVRKLRPPVTVAAVASYSRHNDRDAGPAGGRTPVLPPPAEPLCRPRRRADEGRRGRAQDPSTAVELCPRPTTLGLYIGEQAQHERRTVRRGSTRPNRPAIRSIVSSDNARHAAGSTPWPVATARSSVVFTSHR
jgi:hypothetical protein